MTPFVDVKNRTFTPVQAFGTGVVNSAFMNIGEGSQVFRADQSGIWLGNAKFGSAPFKVDMEGNATATSMSISGYISTGGAAADVNANATTIDGGKITANSITASQIQANTITATELASSYIVVGDAADDVNDGSTEIEAGKISISGSTQLADWRHPSDQTTIDGGDIYANSVTASQIAANTITASQIASNTITASEIASGTITATQISSNTITGSELSTSRIDTTSQYISSGLKVGGSGESTTYLKLGTDIVMDGNNIQSIDQALFSENTSAPSSSDGIWYYKSGGSYAFRTRMEGGNWSIDQTAA